MTIATYSELKTEVADFSHRTDLTAKMDTFCLLAEAVINKDLRSLEMEKRLATSFDDAFYDLPSDYLALRQILIETDGARLPLPIVTPQLLSERYAYSQSTLSAGAIHGGQIELRPAPTVAAPITGEITYYARIPTLVTNSTNDILTAYPMIYLSAMLIQVYLYLQDSEETATWTSAYNSQILQANKQGGRNVLPQVRVA